MAKRRNRYLEARMYMTGSSVGLLLILWSALMMKDRLAFSNDATDATLVVEAGATAQPAAAAQQTTTTTAKQSTTSAATATPAPTTAPTTQAVAVPQTRSKAS